MSEINDLFLRLALALGVGLIVGVERGWQQRDEPEGRRTAGIRTFALIGLAGGVAAALSTVVGSYVPWLATLILLTLVFAYFNDRENAAAKQFSVTNVVAAMTVFLLGVMAVVGDIRIAAAGGVVIASLLAVRQTLHQALAKLTWTELRAALLLAAMTAVVLPLLPNRTIDPFNAVNPRELWLLMTLVAAVSFAGYIALRVAGPDKGPPAAGLAGGLASPTAVTIAMARLSRRRDDSEGLGAAICLASMVSVIRAAVLASIVQPQLIGMLAAPAVAAALVFGAAGAIPLLRKKTQAVDRSDQGAPFDLLPVLGFGLLLAAVTFFGAWITRHSGEAGDYAFSAVSGLLDVDAITLSNARSVARGVIPGVAATAIVIAWAANAAQRAVFAWIFGSRALAARFAAVTVVAVAAGGLAFATA